MSSLSDAAPRGAQLELTPRGSRLHLHLPRLSVSYRSLVSIGLPALLFLTVLSVLAFNALTRVVFESDSAMHLLFMKIIAGTGHLPTHIPHFAAKVAPGGSVEAWFPYQYTPLYHIVGAGFYKVGGPNAVLLLGPLCGAIVALLLFHLVRPSVAWPFALVGAALVLIHRNSWPVFTWVFMEPMCLVFFIGSLLYYRRLWSGGGRRNAVAAGVLLGLAISTRQTALMYAAFMAMHSFLSVTWGLRGCTNRWAFLRGATATYGLMFGTAGLVALPAVGYLFWMTGNVGYGAIGLPGFVPHLEVDPAANAYISSITTPGLSLVDWADRFKRIILYMNPWSPWWYTYAPLALYVLGTAWLLRKRDKKHTFLATYALVHLLGEFVLFLTVHGSVRYVIASRILFYSVVAVGLFALWHWVFSLLESDAPGLWGKRAQVGVLATACVLVFVPAFVSGPYLAHLSNFDAPRSERARAYEELGDWIKQKTPPGSLILSGRWYAPALYFDRDYTWVTYYGNTWAVEASQATDPQASMDILARYGVDYVIVQKPPGSYVDRMPQDGLRHTLLEDQQHFKLVFRNDRTRLYQFFPDGQASRADYVAR